MESADTDMQRPWTCLFTVCKGMEDFAAEEIVQLLGSALAPLDRGKPAPKVPAMIPKPGDESWPPAPAGKVLLKTDVLADGTVKEPEIKVDEGDKSALYRGLGRRDVVITNDGDPRVRIVQEYRTSVLLAAAICGPPSVITSIIPQLRCVEDVFVSTGYWLGIPNDGVTALPLILQLVAASDIKPAMEVWKCAFPDANHECPPFRASAIRQGTHDYNSMDIGPVLGSAVRAVIMLPVALEEYQLEFWGFLDDVGTLDAGIKLSPQDQALARRSRPLVHPFAVSLRSTIAAQMVKAAQIRPGDVVVDSMCGLGVIPVEAQRSQRDCVTIGGDLDTEVVTAAAKYAPTITNPPTVPSAAGSDAAGPRAPSYKPEGLVPNIIRRPIDYLFWDCTRIPFRDCSVDVMMVDLPYGRRVGKAHECRKLYPPAFMGMSRVLRIGGRVVLLTRLVKYMVDALNTVPELTLISRRPVDNQGMETWIYVLVKTSETLPRPWRDLRKAGKAGPTGRPL